MKNVDLTIAKQFDLTAASILLFFSWGTDCSLQYQSGAQLAFQH